MLLWLQGGDGRVDLQREYRCFVVVLSMLVLVVCLWFERRLTIWIMKGR